MGPYLQTRAQSGSQSTAPHGTPAAPQMQDPKAALLAQMDDVKTPGEIGIWPPAPGWWLLSLLILLSLFSIGRYIVKKIKSQRYRKYALRELASIAKNKNDKALCYENIMQVLKRTFFTAYPNSRAYVAGVYGKQWLQLLQKTSKTSTSIDELGNIIDTELYGKANDESKFLNELIALSNNWVKHHKPMSEKVWGDILAASNAKGAHNV